MDDTTHPLQAVSNVIELKPDHKYLLVFKGDSIRIEQLDRLSTILRQKGIESVSVSLAEKDTLEILEVPENKPQAYTCRECGKEIVPDNQYRAWINGNPRNVGFVCEECYVQFLERHG